MPVYVRPRTVVLLVVQSDNQPKRLWLHLNAGALCGSVLSKKLSTPKEIDILARPYSAVITLQLTLDSSTAHPIEDMCDVIRQVPEPTRPLALGKSFRRLP